MNLPWMVLWNQDDHKHPVPKCWWEVVLIAEPFYWKNEEFLLIFSIPFDILGSLLDTYLKFGSFYAEMRKL